MNANTIKATRDAKHNTVELRFPFGLPFERLYCPACGEAIIEEDVPFEGPRCKHLEWIYLDGLREFAFTAPAIQERIDELSQRTEVDDCFDLCDELQKTWASNTTAVFSITTGGMACGPIWETARYGLNLVLDE